MGHSERNRNVLILPFGLRTNVGAGVVLPYFPTVPPATVPYLLMPYAWVPPWFATLNVFQRVQVAVWA